MRVLLIEDDPQTAEFVSSRLRKTGCGAEHHDTAEAGLSVAAAHPFDAIVIDRMLPGMDGLLALQRLRQAGNTTPVLMLSALNDMSCRAEGLFAGADDYLCKPFAWEELYARLHALVRRRAGNAQASQSLQAGPVNIDRLAKRVTCRGQRVDLVAREYDVLEYLALRPDQIVTRTMLLQDVWNLQFDPGTNIVESQISRLRTKLAAAGGDKLIHTSRGQGYMLRAA